MQKTVRIFACLVMAALSAPAIAANDTDENISYIVQRGDTLINMGTRYLITPSSYLVVQRYNKISNPRALPVGKTIRIPRSLLKYQAASAKILSVRGNVRLGSSAASTGQLIAEGATLKTAAASFVTLGLPNGSRVSLPSNSDLRIRLLRTYTLGSALDYDFDVIKGGANSVVSPLKSKDDRYRVRTPRSVSAVRGTEFQVRYDDQSSQEFAEVIEGGLAVNAGGITDLALPAGNGLAVPVVGDIIKEALLPEPNLIEPSKVQANAEIQFAVAPKTNEAGYRLTWATDAGFVDQIADITTKANETKLASIADGNYFIRARAISQNGIQGQPVTYAFKRRLNGVLASTTKDSDGYKFKWQNEGIGIRKYHFQLFKEEPNGKAMVDEPALSETQIALSDLPPGNYFWRVGAVQYADGEVATNWTRFEKLSVAP
jgi:hypothetical protein